MVVSEVPQPSQFLDIPTLLERSQRKSLGLRPLHLLGVFMLVVLVSTYFGTRSAEASTVLNLISGLTMVGLVGALSTVLWFTVRKARAEQMQLEGIEELMRLRRWSEAGASLENLLGRPTRTPQARIQGLIYLTSVLARYNRFEDAISVQDYLLEQYSMDGSTAYGLKLARAMAMLRQDHLVDADKAINELRQQVSRAGRARDQVHGFDPNATEDSPQSLSAGLALLELYRDVKTGHPAEAIELFNSTLPSLREQLGQRVSDPYILVAKAYDLLGRTAEAQSHFEKATLLAAPAELYRRYPEVEPLSARYQPASAPQEAQA